MSQRPCILRHITFAVVIVLVAVSAGAVVWASEFELTASQKHFTSIVRGLPGIAGTEWRSPVSLYVKATSRAVGSPVNPALVKALADTLAERGRTAMGQPFCIHIYRGDDAELARSCVY